MYRSEACFTVALVSLFRSRGYMVQRIESGETGVGIPDIYAVRCGKHYWIEDKNMPTEDTPTDSFKVDWRPGQQAWARAYLQYSGEHSYTVVAFKKTIAIIPMVKVFRGNIVQYGEYSIHANIGDVEREIRGCTIH